VRSALKVAQVTLIVCGGLLLLLGMVMWTGNGGQLIGPHVLLGVVLVLSLWTITAIAVRSGVSVGTAVFAAAWGLLVVVFGWLQGGLLPGSWHWAIQVVHLGISMGAIWWGRRLAELIRRALSATEPIQSARPILSARS
jgi:hypothetical protein